MNHPETTHELRDKRQVQGSIISARIEAFKAFPDADEVKVCRAYGGELIAEIRTGSVWTLYYTGHYLV